MDKARAGVPAEIEALYPELLQPPGVSKALGSSEPSLARGSSPLSESRERAVAGPPRSG